MNKSIVFKAIKRGLYEGLDFNDDELAISKKKVDSFSAINKSKALDVLMKLLPYADNKSLKVDNIYKICMDYNIKFPMPDDKDYFEKFIKACINEFGNDLDLNWIDTSNVTDISYIFYECKSLISLDISLWDTSNVLTMDYMFDGCENLTSLDVSQWDTYNVVKMEGVFNGCKNLNSLDVGHWDTSNVSTMWSMFQRCENLTSLDVSQWDTSKVTGMILMFAGCKNLTSLDVSRWDTSNVKYMDGMFDGCHTNIIPAWYK